jgi:chromosome segregation ATPase
MVSSSSRSISARRALRAEAAIRGREFERRRRAVDRRRASLDAKIALLRDRLEAASEDLEQEVRLEQLREKMRAFDQIEMAQARMVDLVGHGPLPADSTPRRNGL